MVIQDCVGLAKDSKVALALPALGRSSIQLKPVVKQNIVWA